MFVKVPKISQEVKMEAVIQGAQSSLLAAQRLNTIYIHINHNTLTNVSQSKVSMMIPVIVADLLRRYN